MNYREPSLIWYIHSSLRIVLVEEEAVAIASSAFGSIPTAARALTKELELLLEGEGLKLRRIKIQREQALDEVDYATLNHTERGAVLNARKLSISKCDLAILKGRTLIVVDDLLATGRHEKAIKEIKANNPYFPY